MDKKLDLKDIKIELAEELKRNLKQCNENILDVLVKYGYSSFEVVQMLARPENAPGIDLINCNRIVKKTLMK